MFTSAAKNLATKNYTTFSVCFSEAKLRLKLPQLHVAYQTNQRTFSAPAWHKPLGDVPMPRKEKAQLKSSEIVPLENIVDRRSLICLENIHDACSTSEVYHALGEHRDNLNEVHVARAMSKLAAIQASASQKYPKNSTQVTKVADVETMSLAIRQDKEFVHLCHLALKHTKVMDSNIFVDVLKAVIDLGVPQTSAMVQTLLASAEQRLNQFNCDGLAQFASRLILLQKTDQRVHALLQAVTLIVPDQIETCSNAISLIILLRAVGKQLDRHTHAQMAFRLIAILNTKQDIEKKQTVQDTAEAIIEFHSIGYHNVQFLNEACKILLNGIEYLPPTKLMQTLYSLSGLRYYNPGFLEEAGNFIANSAYEFTLYHLSRILNTYSSQRYLHEKLLNSAATSLISRPLDHKRFIVFIGILSPFAKFQYVPPSVPPSSRGMGLFDLIAESAERQLDSRSKKDLDRGHLVYLVALLAMCGYYSPRLVETALSRSCYEPVLKDPKNLPDLRALHNMIIIDKPKLPSLPEGDFLSVPNIKELSDALDRLDEEEGDARITQDDKFKMSVAEVLKDETKNSRFSWATNVFIRNGYTADFVVSDQNHEKTPTAIDLTRHTQYCANYPERPLAQEAIKQRHLVAMGYTFHMIRRVDWMALDSPQARTEYIRQVLSLSPGQREPDNVRFSGTEFINE